MRLRPFLILITLVAAPAFAQPVMSDEVSSTPIASSLSPWNVVRPAVAMAADRTGAAIAWSMPNAEGVERVYVARLDQRGHIGGALHALPLLNAHFFSAIKRRCRRRRAPRCICVARFFGRRRASDRDRNIQRRQR